MVARLAAGLRAARSLAFVALLAPTLGACAYGVGDLFGDDPPPPPPPVFVPKTEAESQAGGGTAAAAEQEESFPTLGQVPERPTPTTQPAEQTEIAQSLAADRQNAQYTRERLTGEMSDGGDPATPPRSAAPSPPTAEPMSTATTASAPPATPLSDGTASDAASTPAANTPGADSMTAADTAPAAMATADSTSPVPAPPSAGGTMADESANVQRAISSRSEITEGTARGSTLQSRSDRPVLQRTERLTAALNSPEASASEVDAFTRRMAAGSSASSATAPGGGTAAATATAAAARRSYPESGAAMQAGNAAAPEVSSARADELLAAKASAELAAYEAQEQGSMTEPAAARTTSAGTAAMADTGMQAARTPEPQLTTRTVTSTVTPAAAGDVEQATQQAIDRQAMAQPEPSGAGRGSMVTEQVTVTEDVTPSGQVTVVETMRETAPAAPAPQPQPQSLADIYAAQLRASSAATLQQAAREGATLAGADGTAGAGYPQQVAANSVPPAGSYRAAPVQAYPAASHAGASGYGSGTVVVSGSGTTTGGARAAVPAAYAAGAGYPGGNVPGVKAGTIRFNAGSSRLGSGDLETLRRIAEQYSRFGGRVLVLGHASSRTGDMPPERHKLVNFDISLERAEAVAAQLSRYGIPTAAMLVEARSDMDPIYFEAMPAAEAANRRAEVYFLR